MLIIAVLIGAILIARLVGVGGVDWVDSWPAATRVGLCAMFLLTASAHFSSMRHDLARMMPPAIPYPMAVVFFTGVCEVLGAFGLLIPSIRRYAAAALIVFLIAILPANIHAANAGVTLRGQPPTPLVIRIPMQILFIALIWWAGVFRRDA